MFQPMRVDAADAPRQANAYLKAKNEVTFSTDRADSFSGGAGTDTAADFNPSQGDTRDNTIS